MHGYVGSSQGPACNQRIQVIADAGRGVIAIHQGEIPAAVLSIQPINQAGKKVRRVPDHHGYIAERLASVTNARVSVNHVHVFRDLREERSGSCETCPDFDHDTGPR